MPTENGDTLGLSVRDLVLEVRSDVKALNTTVTSLTEKAEVGHDTARDHEDRLRGLERWRYGIPFSGLAALSALLVAIVNRL